MIPRLPIMINENITSRANPASLVELCRQSFCDFAADAIEDDSRARRCRMNFVILAEPLTCILLISLAGTRRTFRTSRRRLQTYAKSTNTETVARKLASEPLKLPLKTPKMVSITEVTSICSHTSGSSSLHVSVVTVRTR